MPKYYFFVFDEVITKAKTDPHSPHIIFQITADEKIRNLSWLYKFITERKKAGDFIFVLSENTNLKHPRYYMQIMFGRNYKQFISHIEACKDSQFPEQKKQTMEQCLIAAGLDSLATLMKDVVLIDTQDNCVEAIIADGGQGVLVNKITDKNKNTYISELEEIVRVSNLPAHDSEAQSQAMLRLVRRSSLRGIALDTAPKNPGESSPTLALRSSLSLTSSYGSTNDNASSFFKKVPTSGKSTAKNVGRFTPENTTFDLSYGDEFDESSKRKTKRWWCCC